MIKTGILLAFQVFVTFLRSGLYSGPCEVAVIADDRDETVGRSLNLANDGVCLYGHAGQGQGRRARNTGLARWLWRVRGATDPGGGVCSVLLAST